MSYKPFDLTGKVCLVTGGNRGIGYGMAQALGSAGATLVIWGSNDERNQRALEKLQAEVSTAVSVAQVNVANEREVVAAMQQIITDHGKIDTVIANAGIGIASGGFTSMSYDDFRKVLSVNQDGAFFTMREGAKHMVEQAKSGYPGGSIIGISSLSAIEGAARNQHYAGTKGALISMIKGVAVEFARYGIRANAILPGWIATDMTQAAQDNVAFEEKVIPRVPFRRWGTPEDFGGLAVYLASDAASFHTGDVLVIDGGYSIF